MAKRLFVGNLAYTTTSAQLEELFSQVGKIASLKLITDKFSGQSKGFAFVEYGTDEEANEAIKKFSEFELDGRKLAVNEARPMEDRGTRPSSGGGRSYDRNKSW